MRSRRFKALGFGIGGMAAAGAALAVSRLATGLPSFAAVIAAAALLPVAIGVALAMVICPAEPGAYHPKGIRQRIRAHKIRNQPIARIAQCRHCGRMRSLRSHCWVCESCDFATISSATQ